MRDGESSINSAPKPLSESFRAELHPQDTRKSMANFWNYHSRGTTRPYKKDTAVSHNSFPSIKTFFNKTLYKIRKKSGCKTPQLKCINAKIMLSLTQIIV